MKSALMGKHFNDDQGNPAGGVTTGTGFCITWQNGPLGRHEDGCTPGNGSCVQGCTRQPQNGAFVEDVIYAAMDRLGYYQASKFACQANAEAIAHLKSALDALNRRTADREARKVEGTHEA